MLSDRQLRGYASRRTKKLICVGPVRSGKSHLSYYKNAQKIKELIDGNLPGDVALIGVTERTVRRNIINPMQDIFGASNIKLVIGRGEAFLWGRRCYVIGADDEAAEGKIKGLTLAYATLRS